MKINTHTTSTTKKDKDYYQRKYISRHPSGNLFSLETLLFNKLIRCELLNRPITLKSRLNYSLWIETHPINREYEFFTMNRDIVISKSNSTTYKDRLNTRKEYEYLFNKEFEYKNNLRISAPHRVFICSLINKYDVGDLKLIIMDSFSLIASSDDHRNRWKKINHFLYKSKYPIDSYYRLGDYPRCEDIFTDENLKNINSIGELFLPNTYQTIFSQKCVYSFKYNSRMTILSFDQSRDLYESKSWFKRLLVKQFIDIGYLFYKLNHSYDYCYVNIINFLNNEKYIENEVFSYEFDHLDAGEYLHPIISRLCIKKENEEELLVKEFLSDSDDDDDDVDIDINLESDHENDSKRKITSNKRKYIDLCKDSDKNLSDDGDDKEIPWITIKRTKRL